MLKWTTSFFVLAIASGVLGFTEVAGPESGTARFLFFVFCYLCVVTALLSGLSGSPPLAWLRARADQWQHWYESLA